MALYPQPWATSLTVLLVSIYYRGVWQRSIERHTSISRATRRAAEGSMELWTLVLGR
jgi:hypothetical protein